MSMLLPRLKQELASLTVAAPATRTQLTPNLDLVHLARHSLGDKSREMELLGRFDQQAGVALQRLRSLTGAVDPAPVARMLGASARMVGAFAVASASDAYAATLASGLPERERARALDILEEEIGMVRAAIQDLLPR